MVEVVGALLIVAQMQSLVPLQHCVGAEPLDADAVRRGSGWNGVKGVRWYLVRLGVSGG